MKKLSTKLDNKYVGEIINRANGITLISLVITIVVLIILVGVTINLTIGENGLFVKAKEARRLQMTSEAKEKIGTEILAAQIEAIERNEELEQSQVEDIISKYGELQDDKDTIILNNSGYTISLLDIYQGTTTTSGSYIENKAKIELLESQVERLQEQLESISQTGDEKDQTIADLNSKVTTLENEKNELQNENNSLTSKATELTSLKETLANTTATKDKILKDYKAYSNGQLITGTMASYAGQIQGTTVTSDDTYTYLAIPNEGYYSTSSELRVKNSEIENVATGNFTASQNTTLKMNLEFTPDILILLSESGTNINSSTNPTYTNANAFSYIINNTDGYYFKSQCNSGKVSCEVNIITNGFTYLTTKAGEAYLNIKYIAIKS